MALSNGASFNGNSSYADRDSDRDTEPWWFQIMRPIQDRGPV